MNYGFTEPREHFMSIILNNDKVPVDRWRAAQDWERNHWVNAQKIRAKFGKNLIWRCLSAMGVVDRYRGNDWNQWWRTQFSNYDFLPKNVENAIEVGCGPYTNIRFVIPVCQPTRLVLSDPLIRTYAKFRLTLVSEAHQKHFCMLDDYPLEETPYRDNFFDLSIMINVLDHVRDAATCMENLIRITKSNGWVIIGQDLTNEDDLKTLASDPGLVGHPIKLSHQWFEPFLKNRFHEEVYKILPREAGREPQNHYGTLLFAGRKI